jgi:hypothetical protein
MRFWLMRNKSCMKVFKPALKDYLLSHSCTVEELTLIGYS